MLTRGMTRYNYNRHELVKVTNFPNKVDTSHLRHLVVSYDYIHFLVLQNLQTFNGSRAADRGITSADQNLADKLEDVGFVVAN